MTFIRSTAPIDSARRATAMPSPTAPTAPDKPAAAPISAEEHAKQEIGQLVTNYCASLQTLSPATTRSLFRVDNERELSQRFRQYKSLSCTVTAPAEYDRLDASAAGGAQLKFGMKQVVKLRSGGPPASVETEVTMVVSRKDFQSPWLIDRVSHEVGASNSRGNPESIAVATADKPAMPIAPSQGGLELIQGETDKAYKARVAAMTKKYDDAVAVLGSQKYEQALTLFNQIMAEVPTGYRDLAQRRAEARAGMRAEAKAAFGAAAAAEKNEDYDGAIGQYRRAHQLDPTIQVDETIQRVNERKVDLGRRKCTEGLAVLALGNATDAIPLLLDAVRLLPQADACSMKARDALQRLRK
jgi:tetratricopeptide (TPR) repeat protein